MYARLKEKIQRILAEISGSTQHAPDEEVERMYGALMELDALRPAEHWKSGNKHELLYPRAMMHAVGEIQSGADKGLGSLIDWLESYQLPETRTQHRVRRRTYPGPE